MKNLQERINEFVVERLKGKQLLEDIKAAFQPEFEAIETKLSPTYSLLDYSVLISEKDHKPYICLGELRAEPEKTETLEGTAVDYGMRCIDQKELNELNDKFKPDFARIEEAYGFKVAPLQSEKNNCLGISLYSENCLSDGGPCLDGIAL